MSLSLENVSWKFTDNREWTEHFRNWPPVIITCAITGGAQGKEANPNLPTAPDEQADQTYEAYKAGCSNVHIHARDPKTNYTQGTTALPEHFCHLNKLIRARCPDIIICDTGSNFFGLPEETQTKYHKQMNSELSSLDVGIVYVQVAYKTTPEKYPAMKEATEKASGGPANVAISFDADAGKMLLEAEIKMGYGKSRATARAMAAANVKPELEVFNPTSWWFVDDLINKGLVQAPYWCQIVFGQNGACSLPTPKSAMDMLADMPKNSIFSAIGTGPLQLPITALAIIMGGHVRVGMEDNVYYKRGELAKSNAQFVERTARLAHELNREVATPAQAREMLQLNKIPKQYP